MLRKLWLFIVVFVCAAPACAQYRHVSLQNNTQALPNKILVLPADVLVREMSAGGMLEKVPEWTQQSSENLTNAMIELGKSSGKFSIVELPPLTGEEREQLEQAIATFMTVGATAHNMLLMGGDAWAHKKREFDYTLGPILSFLKQKTGADAAMMLAGDDIVSSGGRKAAVIFAAALGVGLSTGRSLALTSVVDLATGNFLWMHYDQSMSKDLKDYASAQEMAAQIMARYPE